VTAMLGMFCLSTALAGYIDQKLTIVERVFLILGGLSLTYPHLVSDLFGFVVFAVIITYQKRCTRQKYRAHRNNALNKILQ